MLCFVCMCVYVHMHVYLPLHVWVEASGPCWISSSMHLIQFLKTTYFNYGGHMYKWESEDNLWGWRVGSSLYHMVLRNQTQVARCGDKLLYLLSHFAGPIFFFETNSFTEPELWSFYLGWMVSEAPGYTYLCLPSVQHLGTRRSKPHTCSANTFPFEPLPWCRPSVSFLGWGMHGMVLTCE